jgi:hypothetical protein
MILPAAPGSSVFEKLYDTSRLHIQTLHNSSSGNFFAHHRSPETEAFLEPQGRVHIRSTRHERSQPRLHVQDLSETRCSSRTPRPILRALLQLPSHAASGSARNGPNAWTWNSGYRTWRWMPTARRRRRRRAAPSACSEVPASACGHIVVTWARSSNS